MEMEMDKGWFKVYRKLIDKPIWSEARPHQHTVLITLLSIVNFQERQWEWNGKVYTAQSGQVITSLASLKERCGKYISIQQLRTTLKRFEKYGFLTNESTNQNRLITITNWDVYQQNGKEKTKELTSEQQSTNKQVTTKKNYKHYKNLRIKPFAYANPVQEYELDLTKGEAL